MNVNEGGDPLHELDKRWRNIRADIANPFRKRPPKCSPKPAASPAQLQAIFDLPAASGIKDEGEVYRG